MATPANRRASYADLLGAPSNVVAEIVDGELITSPRPAPRHAVASSALGIELGGPFQFGRSGPGGWWIIDEPELHLGPDVLVPDLAGWRKTTMPTMPEGAHFEMPPNWICEVLSPSTARLDRVAKLPIYAREIISHVWLIDPAIRTVEVLRREGLGWLPVRTASADECVRLEPFDAVSLDLLSLWGETRNAG